MTKETLKEIKRIFPNIKLDEEKFEYMLTKSIVPIRLYDSNNEEDIIKCHLNHIKGDYEEDGWTLVDCTGNIYKVYGVLGLFLFCKIKESKK